MVIPLIVFLSGACVMTVEIVGARIIAPYVGNTIHSWTALISVILASLSIGYMIGGKLADRYPSVRILSVVFFASAVAVSLIKTFEWILLPLITVIPDARLLAVVLSIGMFTIPSILLGMISPYTIRLSLNSIAGSGATSGTLSALSTIGSIVGTVITGFYLLGSVGHTTVLYLVTGILIGCGGVVWVQGKSKSLWVLIVPLFALVWPLQTRGIAHPFGREIETDYHRIFVADSVEPTSQRPIRTLSLDIHGIQSAMYTDIDNDFVSEYTKVFRVAEAYAPDARESLMIGGAGYDFPKDFLRRQRGNLQVVEIDPGMTEVANVWFNLPNDERLQIAHEDGRIFLTNNRSVYDVIYMDAFGALVTPPFHLLTKEMYQIVAKRLGEDGVFVMNTIGSFEGPGRQLLHSIMATLYQVFPVVHVYNVDPAVPGTATKNIVLVAMKEDKRPVSTDPQIVDVLKRNVYISISDGVVFTDEFAPVEQYAMEMIL